MVNQSKKKAKPKASLKKKASSILREPETSYAVRAVKSTNQPKSTRHTNQGSKVLSSQFSSDQVAYSISEVDITKTFSWLGMKGVAIRKLSSEFDFIELSNSGITKNAINALAENIGISRKYISETIFDVSVKTMERKDNRTKLDKKISSHAIEIAKVVQHAWQVFRDETKVKRWLNQQNRALNNQKPVELFDTLSGIVMVGDILGRIEEGVYS